MKIFTLGFVQLNMCFKILSITTKRKEIDNIMLKTLEGRNWNTENLKNPKESRKGKLKDTLSVNETAFFLCLCLSKSSKKGCHLTTANISRVPILCRCSCGMEETICMNTHSPCSQGTQHPKDSRIWDSPNFTSNRFIGSFSPVYQKWG